MSGTRRFPLHYCPVCNCRISGIGMCVRGCHIEVHPEKRRAPMKLPILVLGFLVAITIGILGGYILSVQVSDALQPHISLNSSVSGLCYHEQLVRMNTTPVIMNATASAEVYVGALESTTPCYGSYDTYYTAIVNDPQQDDFYANLLQQFRIVKDCYHLNDDQYVELLATYVQSIPYDRNASVYVKYPVVTAVGGVGDCDDTSLLLAGLLAREGYDTELILYPKNGHMATGIRTDERYAFPDTGGYAYIETTEESLIFCGNFSAGILNESEVPVCIRIGNGTKSYTASQECYDLYQYIQSTRSSNESVKNQPINLGSRNPDEITEEEQIYQINAFDREYLYRYLESDLI